MTCAISAGSAKSLNNCRFTGARKAREARKGVLTALIALFARSRTVQTEVLP